MYCKMFPTVGLKPKTKNEKEIYLYIESIHPSNDSSQGNNKGGMKGTSTLGEHTPYGEFTKLEEKCLFPVKYFCHQRKKANFLSEDVPSSKTGAEELQVPKLPCPFNSASRCPVEP